MYASFLVLICYIVDLVLCFTTALKLRKLKRKSLDDVAEQCSVKAPKLSVSGTASKKAAADTDPLAIQQIQNKKLKKSKTYPLSFGCARTSIDGWQWHKWSLHASASERACVRGIYKNTPSEAHLSNVKGLSARTNRVKMRSLLAAADGADLIKANQLNVIIGYKSQFLFKLISP